MEFFLLDLSKLLVYEFVQNIWDILLNHKAIDFEESIYVLVH